MKSLLFPKQAFPLHVKTTTTNKQIKNKYKQTDKQTNIFVFWFLLFLTYMPYEMRTLIANRIMVSFVGILYDKFFENNFADFPDVG